MVVCNCCGKLYIPKEEIKVRDGRKIKYKFSYCVFCGQNNKHIIKRDVNKLNKVDCVTSDELNKRHK